MHVLLLSLVLLDVRALACDLLRSAGPQEDYEKAAFVIRDERGELSLVHWPQPRPAFRAAHWKGPLPPRVVGVVHTHPSKVPRPSLQDVFEARRLEMPFYVISRKAFCVVSPEGAVECESVRLRHETIPRNPMFACGSTSGSGHALGRPLGGE